MLIHLIGELNPYGADPDYALYDEPRAASGWRLRELIFGIPRRRYLDPETFRRQNLCVGEWSRIAARQAMQTVMDGVSPGDLVIGLGRRVTSSHVWTDPPRPFDRRPLPSRRAIFLSLPHPSGLCREWNDPYAITRARRILAELAPHVEWGLLDGGPR